MYTQEKWYFNLYASLISNTHNIKYNSCYSHERIDMWRLGNELWLAWIKSYKFLLLESWLRYWLCSDFVVNKYGNLKPGGLYLNYSFLNVIFQQWKISTMNPLAFVLSLHLTFLFAFVRKYNLGVTT